MPMSSPTGKPGESTGKPGSQLPADPRDPDFLCRVHLLLLDAAIEPSDATALISNRLPELPAAQPLDGDRAADAVLSRRLSRHSRLLGPIEVDERLRSELGLPDWVTTVFALRTPRDREAEPPPGWFTPPDGLGDFFPAGLPDREEGRGIDLLIAVARRLHTAVRLADEAGPALARTASADPSGPAGFAAGGHNLRGQAAGDARILTPDPASHVDLVVYSHYWLAPVVLLERVRTAIPQARMPLPLSDEQIAALGPEVDPDEPIVLDGYAIEAELNAEAGGASAAGSHGPASQGDAASDQDAGFIEIGVIMETAVPPIVAAHAEGPQISYRLRWMPPGTDTGEAPDTADPVFRAHREHAATLIERAAAVIIRATAGIGVDHDGFLVSAQQLDEPQRD